MLTTDYEYMYYVMYCVIAEVIARFRDLSSQIILLVSVDTLQSVAGTDGAERQPQ